MSDRFPTGYAVLDGLHLVKHLGDAESGDVQVRRVPLDDQGWLLALDVLTVPHERLDAVQDREDLVALAELHGWPVKTVRGLPVPAWGSP